MDNFNIISIKSFYFFLDNSKLIELIIVIILKEKLLFKFVISDISLRVTFTSFVMFDKFFLFSFNLSLFYPKDTKLFNNVGNEPSTCFCV